MAKTARGADAACYGIRGQNVWYTFTLAGPTTVTLTSISGGDPDLWVLDANFNTVGSSVAAGSTNESVSVGSAGTYYAFVHVWSTAGACVNYTIWW